MTELLLIVAFHFAAVKVAKTFDRKNETLDEFRYGDATSIEPYCG